MLLLPSLYQLGGVEALQERQALFGPLGQLELIVLLAPGMELLEPLLVLVLATEVLEEAQLCRGVNGGAAYLGQRRQ